MTDCWCVTGICIDCIQKEKQSFFKKQSTYVQFKLKALEQVLKQEPMDMEKYARIENELSRHGIDIADLP